MLGHKTRVKMKIRVNHKQMLMQTAEAIAGPSEPAPSEAGPLWLLTISIVSRYWIIIIMYRNTIQRDIKPDTKEKFFMAKLWLKYFDRPKMCTAFFPHGPNYER